MRVEESIVIDRPAEEVFGFLSVRANDPVWMASVTESEWLDPAEPRSGAPRTDGHAGHGSARVPG
jgi:uncharacterized membrane protein